MTLPPGDGFPLPNELSAPILKLLSITESKEISLTCKSFRSLCLPQLFSRFCLKPWLNDFTYVGGGVGNAYGESTIRTFLLGQVEADQAREKLRFFTSPSICRHVRCCQVGPRWQVNLGGTDDYDTVSDPYLILDEFFEVLPCLINLGNGLWLTHVPFTPKRLSQLNTIPQHMLSLSNCTLPSVQHIPQIHATNVMFNFDSRSKNGPMYQFWHHIFDPSILQRLEVRTEGETWQFFHSIPTLPHLKKLEFATGNDGTCFHLRTLLTKFPALIDFTFSYITSPSHRQAIVGDAGTNNSKLPMQRFAGPLELLHVVANPELKVLSIDYFPPNHGLPPGDLVEKLITESTGLENLEFFAADIQRFDADLFRVIRTHMPRLKTLHLGIHGESNEMNSLKFVACDTLSRSLEHIYLRIDWCGAEGDALSCIKRLMSHPALKSIFISQIGTLTRFIKRRDVSEKWKDLRELLQDDPTDRLIDYMQRYFPAETLRALNIPPGSTC